MSSGFDCHSLGWLWGKTLIPQSLKMESLRETPSHSYKAWTSNGYTLRARGVTAQHAPQFPQLEKKRGEPEYESPQSKTQNSSFREKAHVAQQSLRLAKPCSHPGWPILTWGLCFLNGQQREAWLLVDKQMPFSNLPASEIALPCLEEAKGLFPWTFPWTAEALVLGVAIHRKEHP